MSIPLSLSGLGQPQIEAFKPLGVIDDQAAFSRHSVTSRQPFMEPFVLIDSFDPTHEGVLALDELPTQADEAFKVMLDDMRGTFRSGEYVLRLMFRQGDIALSADKNFHNWHCDFEGNSLATYMVSDVDPTQAIVNGKIVAGDPYQVVRLRGDVRHRRPPNSPIDRSTAIANLVELETFNNIGGGFLAEAVRATGMIEPARYL
jgi:hypothetical protein